MNPSHIEVAIQKELSARRRKWWDAPLLVSLVPAILAFCLLVTSRFLTFAGLSFAFTSESLDFHDLATVAHGTIYVANLWLQIVIVFYLARSLLSRDDALFWHGVGLGPMDLIVARTIVVVLLLPAMATVLAMVVVASLGSVDVIGRLLEGRAFLGSAANLVSETPTLALLTFTGFLAQSLWLLPVYATILLVSESARRSSNREGHPLARLLILWLVLAILGDFIHPLGTWLTLLAQHDPILIASRLELAHIHLPMLLFNTGLGIVLLLVTALYRGRPES